MSKTSLLLAGTLLSAALLASAARADTVDLSGNLLDYNDTTVIASPTSPSGQAGSNGDFYSSPLIMQGTYVGGPENGEKITLFGFCVDIYHEIYVPFSDLSYQIQPVTNNNNALQSGDGQALTPIQIAEIGYLTEAGYNLYKSVSPVVNLDAQEAGIQDAIWELEYPGSSYTFTPDSNSAGYASTYYADAVADYSTFKGTLFEVSPVGGGADSTQSFAFDSTVPEPAAWALMLVGVGAIGASLRLRRREARVA